MEFNFKNYQIDVLAKVLNYTMPFQKGRVKSRFLNLFKDRVQENEANRIEILKKLADKDKEGKPKMKEADGRSVYDLSFKNLAKFNEEFNILLNEPCAIQVSDVYKGETGMIKEFINNSPVELDPRETNVAEEILLVLDGEKSKKEAKVEAKPAKKAGEKIMFGLSMAIYGEKKLLLAFEYATILAQTAKDLNIELTPEIIKKTEAMILSEFRRNNPERLAVEMLPNILSMFEPN